MTELIIFFYIIETRIIHSKPNGHEQAVPNVPLVPLTKINDRKTTTPAKKRALGDNSQSTKGENGKLKKQIKKN